MEVQPREHKVEDLAADVVEEHVKRPGLADEVLLKRGLLVVECLGYADLFLEPSALLVRAGGGVHLRTLVFGEDARHHAYGACSAGYENHLARLHLPYVDETLAHPACEHCARIKGRYILTWYAVRPGGGMIREPAIRQMETTGRTGMSQGAQEVEELRIGRDTVSKEASARCTVGYQRIVANWATTHVSLVRLLPFTTL